MSPPLSEVRRRALRAAAAAAGASMLACGGSAEDTQVVGDTLASRGVADAAVQGQDVVQDAASLDASPEDTVSVAPADVSSAQDAADVAADAASTADAPGVVDSAVTVDVAAAADGLACPPLEDGEPECKPLQGTPEWAVCCDERLKWCQTKHGAMSEAVNICQFGSDFGGACTGCMPWGPPAPPRFVERWSPRVAPNGPVFSVT